MQFANAQSIIRDAATALHDTGGVRWPAAELVGYLNEGQLALAARRPDAVAVTHAFDLVAGARQVLGDNTLLLLDVHRNTQGRMRAVTRVEQNVLDATDPIWASGAESGEVRHYMYDPREPRTFLVYPPARAGTQVQLTFAENPAPVAEPGGPAADSVTGPCAVGVQWASALLYFVMFRAKGKDVEAGSADTAAAYLALFKAELGEPVTDAAI